MGSREHGGDGLKLAAQSAELFDIERIGPEQGELRLLLPELSLQHRTRAGNGVSLFLEQGLDAQAISTSRRR